MNKNAEKLEKNARGFVLVLVLFTVLILATLIIGLLNLTAIDADLTKNHIYSLQAYYIAEAGIADAISELRENGPNADSYQENFPQGTSSEYSVVMTDSSPVVITSTGIVTEANFRRTLEVRVDVTGGGMMAPYDTSIVQWKETSE